MAKVKQMRSTAASSSCRRQSDPQLVERYGRDQQRSLRDLLVERVDIQQDQAVVEYPDDQQAEDRAQDRAATAGEGGAAEDHGRHDLQLVAAAGVRRR